MTQLEMARRGELTAPMRLVASCERVDEERLMSLVAGGTVVIPANPRHSGLVPVGIGQELRTKVNANIGTSSDFGDVSTEVSKLQVVIDSGADTVMDLSTGGDLPAIRKALLANCPLPLGTVPIYQSVVQSTMSYKNSVGMTVDQLFEGIIVHCRDGVDFITVHCGLTRRALEILQAQGRIADIVSRGGAFLVAWMLHNDRENPLYEYFDRLLEIVGQFDVTLSLGDGLRPGCLADATDGPQLEELITLGELVTRARQAGVQSMVEGPGHLPIDHIETNVKLQKSLCHGAPFYVLGPLVTDIAAGYDHITGAIGGAIAAAAGADFLCYVTPAEHLSIPNENDVREGIMASRIAAHAGDIAKGIKGAAERDRRMSVARKRLDWGMQANEALDPVKFKDVHAQHVSDSEACSMCGKYCAMKMVDKSLGKAYCET